MNLGHDFAKLRGRLIGSIRAGTKKLASEKDVASSGNLSVSSVDFPTDGRIPERFAGQRAPSPAIAWTGVPNGTEELALVCEDTDAPASRPFVHWVVYGVPPSVSFLAQGANLVAQGKNSTGQTGFTGPKPPPGHGVHHYHFQVFALDAPTRLPAGANRDALVEAMDGHVLDWGEVIGTYEAR
jgi:Raf kinase inhibitor-like YbhB/YbcL family protein